jgi:hypothetical protein
MRRVAFSFDDMLSFGTHDDTLPSTIPLNVLCEADRDMHMQWRTERRAEADDHGDDSWDKKVMFRRESGVRVVEPCASIVHIDRKPTIRRSTTVSIKALVRVYPLEHTLYSVLISAAVGSRVYNAADATVSIAEHMSNACERTQ